jgi:KaiC/GvpD/RAD55 family RecA-like ATPase
MQYTEKDGLEKIDFTLTNHEDLLQEYAADLKEFVKFMERDGVPNKKQALRLLRNKLAAKWYPTLGFEPKNISADIQELMNPTPVFERSMNLKKILESYDPSDQWLIPNLLQAGGMYIFGAEPKCGKSLLAYQLAYSFAISGRFLGLPVKKGRVLYWQLEENRKTIASRVYMAGFGNKNDKGTSLLVNFDPDALVVERIFDATIEIPYLQKRIMEFSPTLVIIDSLRASTANSEFSENSSEFGKIVAKLKQVFTQTDTCGVVIHHLSKEGAKNGQKGSLVNALSGSTSISSNSDGIIAIFKTKKEDYNKDTNSPITLTTLPRQGKPMTIEYSMVKLENGLDGLEVLSETADSNHELTGKLLRHFAANCDKAYTVKELSSFGGTFEVKQSLSYLTENQTIIAVHDGTQMTYTMMSDSLWMIEPEKAAKQYSPAVLDAHNAMLCKDKRALYDLTHDWTAERRKAALKLLFSDEERERLKQLTTSFLYQVGDVVSHNGEDFTVTARSEKASLRDVTYTVVDEAGQEYVLEEMLIDGIAGNVVVTESSVVIEESIEDEF